VDRKFTWQFSSNEASANARVLSRALYGKARATYVAVLVTSVAAVLGVTLVGVYLGWWDDFSSAALIVGVGLAFLISRFVASRLAKRARSDREIEGRTVEYEFGEDGYRIHTETFEGFQKWAGVDRIIDAKGSILFVLGLNAHFLPDRLFASIDARREFLAWALDRISPEARARSGIRAIPSDR
jgi:F0F1-type ATP synthase assembly protein I